MTQQIGINRAPEVPRQHGAQVGSLSSSLIPRKAKEPRYSLSGPMWQALNSPRNGEANHPPLQPISRASLDLHYYLKVFSWKLEKVDFVDQFYKTRQIFNELFDILVTR